VALFASNTSGAIVNNQLALQGVANGTAVPVPLNVLVDGAPAMSNLEFASVAPYRRFASGVQITVESSATPGATMPSISPNFVPATDTRSRCPVSWLAALGWLIRTQWAPGRAAAHH
jgi:hypothetical protein